MYSACMWKSLSTPIPYHRKGVASPEHPRGLLQHLLLTVALQKMTHLFGLSHRDATTCAAEDLYATPPSEALCNQVIIETRQWMSWSVTHTVTTDSTALNWQLERQRVVGQT